ncbi:MAG: CHAT domain-containing protein, partial [Nitrospirales bacterium]|nr:CHAT domain-containing protein [Nitrospirales bacterium]
MAVNRGEANRLLQELRPYPARFKLASALSLAVRVDQPFLRQTRLSLVPQDNTSGEIEIWFGPLVERFSSSGFVFHPLVAEDLRVVLKKDQELLDQVWSILRIAHAHLSPAVRLEEEVTWMALKGYSDHALQEKLCSGLKALLHPGREALASWATRAIPRLPENARQGFAASRLQSIGTLKEGGFSTETSRQSGIDWKHYVKVSGDKLITVSAILKGPHLTLSRQPTADLNAGILEIPHTVPQVIQVSWKKDNATYTQLVELEQGHSAEIRYSGFELTLHFPDGTGYRIFSNSCKTISDSENLDQTKLRQTAEDERGDQWEHLRITTQKDGSLKFESLTNLVLVKAYLQPTQRKLIERFLERTSSSTQNDPELSKTFFELMIPNRLKEYAPDRRNMVLVLDEESAGYPWELLNNPQNPHGRPLSVEFGMIRQLAVTPFREKVLHGTALNALVIGDPTRKGSAGKFSTLPGAAAEAREVAKVIRQHEYRNVVELVQGNADPESVLTALYKQPYRILHCAAHGVFEFPLEGDSHKLGPGIIQKDSPIKSNTITGIVLGGGVFLTQAEFEQMRYIPELVFLNCCYFGRTNGSGPQSDIPFHLLASKLGTQLTRMGVRAVIAAGWPVNDLAAKTFARKFYEEMFRNSHFGDAVRKVREEIYLRHGRSNTWGAYQCYGDPDFSFQNGSKIITIFVSYARPNRDLAMRFLKKFRKQMASSKQHHYTFWRDNDILVGEKWHEEIQHALGECDVGLVLLSPAFLGSQYIQDHELPKFVKGGDRPVIPVMLQPIDWERHD